MKRLRDIRRNRAIQIVDATVNGGFGLIDTGSFVASVAWGADEDGWEHVSVSPYPETYTPSWDEMCKVKDIFFNEDECCVEYHPKKKDYINVFPYCLHIWKPQHVEIPTPPKFFV